MGVGATIKDDGMNQCSFFDGEKPLRIITLLSLSGEAVAVIHQIKIQTEIFGAVMQFAYIWNLYDLFSLTLLGLAGNLPLLVKLDDLNEQIEREIFLKRGY